MCILAAAGEMRIRNKEIDMNKKVAAAATGLLAAAGAIVCIIYFRQMLNEKTADPAAIENRETETAKNTSPADHEQDIKLEAVSPANGDPADDMPLSRREMFEHKLDERSALREPDLKTAEFPPDRAAAPGLITLSISKPGEIDLSTPEQAAEDTEVELPPLFETRDPAAGLFDEVGPAIEPLPGPGTAEIAGDGQKPEDTGTARVPDSGDTTGRQGVLSPAEYWLSLKDKNGDENATVTVFDGGESAAGEQDEETENLLAIPRRFKPMNTIEGYGGGHITPTAYLSELSHKEAPLALPSVSFQFYKLGSKDIETLTISDTFFGRVELSYALSRLGLGSLDNDIRDGTPFDIVRNDIYLHTFNIRGLILPEDSFDWAPAITAGVHFKYNDTIQTLDRRMGRSIRNIGLERSNGTDFTLTLSKTLADPFFSRPLSLSGGLRFSQAAQLGYLGFADAYRLSFEGNVFYNPVDNLWLGYEIRQKRNPYDNGGRLLGEEDWWHALSVRYNINTHFSISAMYGHFGTFANSHADCTWGFQLRYKF